MTLFFSLLCLAGPVANALTSYHFDFHHKPIVDYHGHDHSHWDHSHKKDGAIVVSGLEHFYGESDHDHFFLEIGELYISCRAVDFYERLVKSENVAYRRSAFNLKDLVNLFLSRKELQFLTNKANHYRSPDQFRNLPLLI